MRAQIAINVVDILIVARWRNAVRQFDGALDGGVVLPGFSLPVREVFPPRKETIEPG